jgi:DNA polymerase (family 10)
LTGLDASSVAALLREFGQRSALRGGNPFRAKACARAADNLFALSVPLENVVAQDRLQEIPGIGDAIADIIKKLHTTGTHPALEKMRKEVPAGVVDLLTIPGLRADKVIKLECARLSKTHGKVPARRLVPLWDRGSSSEK